MILRNDHIAGAKQAQALAKGQVHVHRDRRARGIGLFVGALEVIRAEIVAPDRRSRVTGIARPGAVIQREKLGRNAESLACGCRR